MKRGVVLPGSTLAEEESIAAAAGRLSAEDIVTLAQVAAWWRYRLARNDAADPVTSLIGGVDARGKATSVGLVSGELTIVPPLVVPGNTGQSFLVHAYGRTSADNVAPTFYSLLGLAHCYNAPSGLSADVVIITRLPGSANSLNLLAAMTPGTNEITLSIAGISGVTIAWKADIYRLEW